MTHPWKKYQKEVPDTRLELSSWGFIFTEDNREIGILNLAVDTWSDNNQRSNMSPKSLTIAYLQVPVIEGVNELYITPRNHYSPILDNLYSRVTSREAIELESQALLEKFKVAVDDNADPVEVRRFLSPKVIQRLIDNEQQFQAPFLYTYRRIWIMLPEGINPEQIQQEMAQVVKELEKADAAYLLMTK